MEKIVDFTMTRLFQLAEYVLDKCTFLINESTPIVSQEVAPRLYLILEREQMRPQTLRVKSLVLDTNPLLWLSLLVCIAIRRYRSTNTQT